MRFFILSGAQKNAGDFLIVERCQQLIKSVYPQCEFVVYDRKKKMDANDIEIANGCDAIVYAGGPSVKKNLYPDIVPLVEDLELLKTKIVSVGMGWGGRTDSTDEILNYKMTESTKKFFKRLEHDAESVSCRDWHTYNVLKNNGIENPRMTGCPAWYNLAQIEEGLKERKEVKKICVSDPADVALYAKQTIQLCKYLKERFSAAEIDFVFHRGSMIEDNYTKNDIAVKALELKNEIEKLGIKCTDISYGCEKLEIYDECDLHIGYRVHAHIYNLSCRNISVLLEEDARGAGVNDALNLRHIRAYDKKTTIPNTNKLLYTSCNGNVIQDVDSWIERIENTDGFDYANAFRIMQESYQVMRNHIKSFV